ncbi:hypothetical protein E4U21_004130 [Claviceps maximensis]|nr:hypothetical protein E4U21_004130 [Claviceps maximensis]
MDYHHSCPGTSLDTSNVEQSPSSQTTEASSPLLFYTDELGNLIPFPTGPAMFPDSELLCAGAPLSNEPSCCLLEPNLDCQPLSWRNSEDYTADSWTGNVMPSACPLSDAFEPQSQSAVYPALASPSSSPSSVMALDQPAPPYESPSNLSSFATIQAPNAKPCGTVVQIDPNHRLSREPPSSLLPPPPPPLPPAPPPRDYIPPYMTPRAIKARELILQCDFPKDQRQTTKKPGAKRRIPQSTTLKSF